MAAKPTHVRAIAELLDSGDFVDSTEAAKAVLAAAENLREDDELWMLVSYYGPGLIQGTGPFATKSQVLKWSERNGMPAEGKHAALRCHTPAYRLKVRP